jgi:alkylation response protein AidB-like acyl-CoA dehydrogenase
MDFDLTEEQAALAESLARLLAARYTPEARQAAIATPLGYAPERWRDFAEMGLTALPFAESDGGLGGTAVETMLVMEAFGRALVVEPYLPTVVLAGNALRLGGSAAQRARWLPGIAAGGTLATLAWAEAGRRFSTEATLRATADSSGWRLDGAKCAVPFGDAADLLVISANTDEGTRLFLVEGSTPGLTRRGYATMDSSHAADLVLAGTPADPLGGASLLDHVLDHGIAAIAAEAVGVMAEMHAMTIDYLKTRKQFGRAIGEFQVLQHRAVDMLVALEAARSMAMFAAMTVEDSDAARRRPSLSAVKIQVAQSLRSVAQAAVQLHGGIGVTMEYRLGSYVRRATALEGLFGDHAHHLRLLAEAGGIPDQH